jgi:hypothetical protein
MMADEFDIYNPEVVTISLKKMTTLFQLSRQKTVRILSFYDQLAKKYQKEKRSFFANISETHVTIICSKFAELADNHTTNELRIANKSLTSDLEVTYFSRASSFEKEDKEDIKNKEKEEKEEKTFRRKASKRIAPEVDYESEIVRLKANFQDGLLTGVESFLDLTASRNATGKIALSRTMSLLGQLVDVLAVMGPEKFKYGLYAAIDAGAPNVNYVKKAAQNAKTGGEWFV